MEEVLKGILEEMKYQTKLLERLVGFEKARADCQAKGNMEQMKMIAEIFKNTPVGSIMEKMMKPKERGENGK